MCELGERFKLENWDDFGKVFNLPEGLEVFLLILCCYQILKKDPETNSTEKIAPHLLPPGGQSHLFRPINTAAAIFTLLLQVFFFFFPYSDLKVCRYPTCWGAAVFILRDFLFPASLRRDVPLQRNWKSILYTWAYSSGLSGIPVKSVGDWFK